jgi:hypothetical protein
MLTGSTFGLDLSKTDNRIILVAYNFQKEGGGEMKSRGWVLAVIFSLVILVGTSAQAQAPKEFKIGAILAMTGAGSWYGQVMSAGFLTAMDEINGSNFTTDGLNISGTLHKVTLTMIDTNEVVDPTGADGVTELNKKIFIFYTIKSREWTEWVSRIFWKMFSSSIFSSLKLFFNVLIDFIFTITFPFEPFTICLLIDFAGQFVNLIAHVVLPFKPFILLDFLIL